MPRGDTRSRHPPGASTTELEGGALGREEGFSLIELMVVVLVLGVLLAVGIPTLLGARTRAADRAAQSDLRTGLATADVIATDQDGSFLTDAGAPLTPANLEAAEPSIDFAAVGSRHEIGVTTAADGSSIVLYAESGSGEWFGIKGRASGAVRYCRGPSIASVDDDADCVATSW